MDNEHQKQQQQQLQQHCHYHYHVSNVNNYHGTVGVVSQVPETSRELFIRGENQNVPRSHPINHELLTQSWPVRPEKIHSVPGTETDVQREFPNIQDYRPAFNQWVPTGEDILIAQAGDVYMAQTTEQYVRRLAYEYNKIMSCLNRQTQEKLWNEGFPLTLPGTGPQANLKDSSSLNGALGGHKYSALWGRGETEMDPITMINNDGQSIQSPKSIPDSTITGTQQAYPTSFIEMAHPCKSDYQKHSDNLSAAGPDSDSSIRYFNTQNEPQAQVAYNGGEDYSAEEITSPELMRLVDIWKETSGHNVLTIDPKLTLLNTAWNGLRMAL